MVLGIAIATAFGGTLFGRPDIARAAVIVGGLSFFGIGFLSAFKLALLRRGEIGTREERMLARNILSGIDRPSWTILSALPLGFAAAAISAFVVAYLLSR